MYLNLFKLCIIVHVRLLMLNRREGSRTTFQSCTVVPAVYMAQYVSLLLCLVFELCVVLSVCTMLLKRISYKQRHQFILAVFLIRQTSLRLVRYLSRTCPRATSCEHVCNLLAVVN